MLRSACATVSQSNSLQSQFIHSRLEFQASPVHFFTRYSNQLILLRSASWPSHMGHRIPCKVSQSIHAWNSESWQYNASRDVLSIVSTPCLRIDILLKQKTWSASVMMSSTRDQLEELSGRIKEISKLIGSRQQASRDRNGRPRGRTGADAWPYVLHVALVVWVLRRDPVLVSQFVAQFEGKRANATWSAQSITSQGEALSTEDKELLLNPLSARGQRALRDARKFLAELSLYTWVRAQNKNKGLAPSSGALWMQWSGQDANSDIAARAKTRRSRSQWLGRWGRRWSVTQGRFKEGDRLPLETLRAKARNVAPPAPQKGNPRPQFWAKNGAQIPGAKRGPLPCFP